MFVRASIVVMLVAAAALQYKYWFSDVGFFRARALSAEVARQEQRVARLKERNRILLGEVRAAKQGLAAVESRARTDLGMIREGETFYLVNKRAN